MRRVARLLFAACAAAMLALASPASAQAIAQFLSTFREFPPSQKVGSFSLDQVMQTLQTAPKGSN